MSTASDRYVEQLVSFLERLGVSGRYFCVQQYDRWVGSARREYEKAEATTNAGPRRSSSRDAGGDRTGAVDS